MPITPFIVMTIWVLRGGNPWAALIGATVLFYIATRLEVYVP